MTTSPPEPTDSGAARDLEDFLKEGADVTVETLDTSRVATGRLPVDAPVDLVLPGAGELVTSGPEGALVTLVIAFSDVKDAPPHPIAVMVNTSEPPDPAEMAAEPGFVGTLSFFGTEHHAMEPIAFRLEASRALSKVDVGRDLTVTLLPMPEPDREPEGQVLDVELSLEIAEGRVER